MKKTLFLAPIFSISCLLQLSANASQWGTWLFCSNKENSEEWKWAPKNNNDGINKNFPISASSKGTWIDIDHLPSVDQYLNPTATAAHLFNSEQEAKEFCSTLQNICTSKFGNNFSNIGISGGSAFLYSRPWGQIAVKYKKDDKEMSSACPNWNYPHFPNGGGQIHFGSGSAVN